jgi:YfiH family protein
MKTEAANLVDKRIRHGFFSARGGASEGQYASLNCGLGSKDEPRCVRENRRRVAEALMVAPDSLVTAHQVHSPSALIIDVPWTPEERPQVDAIVTATPGIAIGVLTADCAPILFADPMARVIGAAHAGWRGAISGVLDDTIDKMTRLGATRERIRATVGPCISAAIYEVGEEFREHFLATDGDSARFFHRPDARGKPHFDLAAYVIGRLHRAGVHNTGHIDHCTFQMHERYFSFRRAQRRGETDYGRQISAIVIG